MVKITLAVTSTGDCDGDGVTNNIDTDVFDPCAPIQIPGYTGYDATDPIWAAADCDGDMELNGDEVSQGTDPYCDQSNSATPNGTCCDPTDTTAGVDCDGDGVDNAQEIADMTDPSNPCEFVLASQNTTPAILWSLADCDGDGVTNGNEVIDMTDPLDPCVYTPGAATVPATSVGDCDGDGVTDANCQ